MNRRVLILFTALLLVLSGSVTAVWFWLGSDGGRQWVVESVESLSGGSLKIQGLAGHPLAHASASKLQFSSASGIVDADAVTLSWSAWRLLTGELSIVRLQADKVMLRERAGPPAADNTSAFPAIVIRVAEMQVGTLIIDRGEGGETRITDIQLINANVGRTLSGALQAHHPDLDLSLQLKGSPKRWHLDGVLKHAEKGEVGFLLSGNYMRDGNAELSLLSGDIDGHVQAQWKLNDAGISAGGDLNLHTGKGDLDGDWTLHTAADFSQAVLNLQSRVENEALLVRDLPVQIKASWANGSLSTVVTEQDHGFALQLDYADAQIQADLTLSGWNSPLKHAAGRLSGDLHGLWHQSTGKWQLKGNIAKGELAGLSASMKIDAAGDAGEWKLQQADIRALGLKLYASGSGDQDQFKLSGMVEAKQVTQALRFAGLEDASGSVKANVNLQGSYQAPQTILTAKLRGFSLQGVSSETVTLSARYAARDGSGQLTATGVSANGRREVENLEVAAGLKSNHLVLTLHSQGRLQSRAKIETDIRDSARREIVITGTHVNYATTELLDAGRLVLHVDGNNIHLPVSALRLMGAKTTASFKLSPDQISGRLDVADLDLSGSRAWFSDSTYHAAGRGDLSLLLAGEPKAPEVTVHITSPVITVRHAMFSEEAGRGVELRYVRAKLDYRQSMLGWQLDANAPADGVVQSSGRLPMLFTVNPWRLALLDKQKGSGRLTMKLARLSDFQALLPRIDPLKGTAAVDLNWTMPATVRSIKGSGNIKLDALGIPEFGLEMNGRLNTVLIAGQPHVDVVLHGGDGDMTMKGLIDMDKHTMPPLRFNHFPLMALPNQQFVVSGSIALLEEQDINVIRGELVVSRMRLEIPEPVPGPTADLQWPSDASVDSEREKTARSKIDIHLTMNGDSEIYGRGMSLKPKGRLHLGGSMASPQLTGMLTIASGKIEFRSVKLDIQPDSRVIFSGDPKRPSIYIRAARKVGDITAGVLVEGPADKLNSKLYSQPAMSNAEIFSYLATGRPLATLGQDNVSDMMTAAEFILGPGTMMQEVQGKVKQTTGLDIFEVGGDASGGLVKAGRRLSDDVTLTAEQTISKEPSTALTLEYMLTRSVSLFARQALDLAPSVGLRYSKEWFGSMKKTAEPDTPSGRR